MLTFQNVFHWTYSQQTGIFMYDVTKTPPYVRNFVYSELLFANVDVSIRFNGKDDNVVLEFALA